MKRTIATFPVLCVLTLAARGVGAQAPNATRVRDTVHNLSVFGPGDIRAVTETEVCVFCHTPHGSQGIQPLWNRSLSTAPYQIYQSSSLQATVGQPTGASKLCLSCHDGTIALGAVLSRPAPISMAGGVDRLPPGPSNLGTDLSDDHPISFAYASSQPETDPELVAPGAIPPPVALDENGEVQCTSCHDPHDNTYGNFLLRPSDNGNLCRSCHVPTLWTTSAHATSGAVITAGAATALGTGQEAVSSAACNGCHSTHGAEGAVWLLDRQNISSTCLTCHNGQVASGDIESEFQKTSGHNLLLQGPTSPLGGQFAEGDRLSCADCHNSHAAGAPEGVPGNVSASLSLVPGVSLDGSPVDSVSHEYELCFRCHGDAAVAVESSITRAITQPNTRLQFQANNPSFHPVGNPGVNPNVPSLLPPYTTASTIGCGDCHASDNNRKVGGTGPAGPHNSIFSPLLVERYDTQDFTIESPSSYALCYRCHSRESILADTSFGEHREHIVELRTPCSACHDSHGIDLIQGSSTNNSNLINFDLSIVFPNSSGRLEFVDLGSFQGECYLTCHGEDHNPERY